jgi:hypothetical protein
MPVSSAVSKYDPREFLRVPLTVTRGESHAAQLVKQIHACITLFQEQFSES